MDVGIISHQFSRNVFPVIRPAKCVVFRHKLAPPFPLIPSYAFAKSISLRSSFIGGRRTNLLYLGANFSSEKSERDSIRDLLEGMVDERVEELLNREENRPLLDGLKKASRRVEIARKELESITKQQTEAARMKDCFRQLENRASQIAECQTQLLEARDMVEEAERSLSSNMEGRMSEEASIKIEDTGIDRETERLESIKAAFISAISGSLAGIPLSFSQQSSSAQLILHFAVIFISCALFGVTFRYTMRRELDNIQLKTGTAAAFSFVRGLAELERGQSLEFTSSSILSHFFDGAMYVSENLVIFLFAAISLDYCFKIGILGTFPVKRVGLQSDRS